MTPAEARSLLGLTDAHDESDVNEARRRLSVIHHPDRGGDTETMAAINVAVDLLLQNLRDAPTTEKSSPSATFDVSAVDHPSFVVDALPVVAFEAVALAVVAIGDVLDEDPPYSMEFSVWLAQGLPAWCRLEIVPDAGSSTVSLSTDGRHDVEALRDRLVDEINRIGLAD